MPEDNAKARRSRNMAAIKGRDTKPEIIVRKYLFSRGLRYRIQVSKLPGKPDIVFPKYKTVVFVNGCFWHGHEGCRYAHIPISNVEFWERKINHNKARDLSNTTVLQMMGWRVIRVWECDLKTIKSRGILLENLYNNIVTPYKNLESKRYHTDETLQQAAEPPENYS